MNLQNEKKILQGLKSHIKNMQKGLMNLLRRHGIDPVKEQTCEQERDER